MGKAQNIQRERKRYGTLVWKYRFLSFFYILHQGKMKTYKNLWEKFVSKENFDEALYRAVLGKKSRKVVKKFLENEEINLEKVRQSVINGSFTTSPYRTRIVYEPKKRTIYKLPFSPDRIVQHAIMNLLRPIMEMKFIDNSFACIIGKGQQAAVKKCEEYVRRNEYCLKCDVSKFFPSIDHDILHNQISSFIKDKKFMDIIDDVIYSIEGKTNCPIGNYCSQWFGNFYLTELDNFIKHNLKIKCYERYCDDFLLFSNDKDELNKADAKIAVFLEERLKLHYSKHNLFKTKQGVDFCGYRVFKKYTLLRKRTAKRIKRKVMKMTFNRKSMSQLASYLGWLKHCNAYHLVKSLDLETALEVAKIVYKNPHLLYNKTKTSK